MQVPLPHAPRLFVAAKRGHVENARGRADDHFEGGVRLLGGGTKPGANHEEDLFGGLQDGAVQYFGRPVLPRSPVRRPAVDVGRAHVYDVRERVDELVHLADEVKARGAWRHERGPVRYRARPVPAGAVRFAELSFVLVESEACELRPLEAVGDGQADFSSE